MQAANLAAQSGDQQFAMTLADYARKAESEMALVAQRTKEGRAAATPKELQIAAARAQLQDQIAQMEAMPPSPERDRALAVAQNTLLGLAVTPEKGPSFGTDRESISAEMFNNKTFAQLTPTEKAAVNKRVEAEQGTKAKAGATSITNVMPGQKDFVDIPKFRRDVQQTIDPQIKTVTAADQALQAINDSLATNNFASFRAGQTQFARAISGSGDLSQKELKAAGADPSLLGGTADYISGIFSGTPTADTQKKIRSTLEAIKKVATAKANAELQQQRKLAERAKYSREDIDAALSFPEFNVAPSTGKKAPVTRTLKSGKVVTVED